MDIDKQLSGTTCSHAWLRGSRLLQLAVLFANVVLAAPLTQAAPLKENLRKIMADANLAGEFDGAVLVALDGVIVYEGAFGPADAEWGKANAVNTRFGIASLTKSFTAHLVMKLVEAGLIDLDAPISSYLAELKGRPLGAVTVRQIGTHTAGVGDHLQFDDTKIPAEIKAKWERFNGASVPMFKDYAPYAKVLETPGQKFHYSNDAYVLLGLVIEAVTGQSFESNLHRHLLVPSQLTNSGINHYQKVLPNRARSYRRENGELLNAPWDDSGSHFSAGGMYSTVGDLHQWHKSLRANAILKRATQVDMATASSPQAWDVFGFRQYGFGWWVKTDEQLGKLMMHPGASPQYSAVVIRGLDRDVFIAVLSNVSSIPFMSKYTPALLNAVSKSVAPVAR